MERESEWMISKADYGEKILKFRKQGLEYLHKINHYLDNQNDENIDAFLNTFREQQLKNDIIISLPELMYAGVFAVITDNERSNGIRPLFIENGNSVQALINILKKIEFWIWRIEFDSGTDAEQMLYECLVEYRLSVEAMKNIIDVAGVSKKSCYLILACVYIEHQKMDAAIRLLTYGLELFPGDETILKYLDQLYLRTGRSIERE